MSFKTPEAMVLLLLLPILAGLYVWMQKRRRRYALQYASVGLVRQAIGSGPGVRRHIPAAIYLIAITVMIMAVARPVATIPVPSNTGTVILAIDVSGSMEAADVQPNRMEATKAAVREFVNKQPSGVKIGVVSFSDFGALVAPPTTERKPVLDAINLLRPQRGTNIGGGLQASLDAIYALVVGADVANRTTTGGSNTAPTPTPPPTTVETRPPPASIVLMSDGQSTTGPQPLTVAQEAADKGIKVYTIGIGTSQGTVVRIQGQSVFTRLDEDTLKGIAEQTGGRYFNAQDESSLRQVYDELSRERKFEDKTMEITFLLTGGALALSIIAGGLGLLWFNRLP